MPQHSCSVESSSELRAGSPTPSTSTWNPRLLPRHHRGRGHHRTQIKNGTRLNELSHWICCMTAGTQRQSTKDTKPQKSITMLVTMQPTCQGKQQCKSETDYVPLWQFFPLYIRLHASEIYTSFKRKKKSPPFHTEPKDSLMFLCVCFVF